MVTAIIPSLSTDETYPYLELCLDSLAETSPEVPIVVALNGYDPHFPNHRDNLTVIRVSGQGQCKAVNEAVWYAKTKHIIVVNDDMVFSPGWVETMIEATEKYRCVSPNLVEPGSGAEPFMKFDCGSTADTFKYVRWIKGYKDLDPEGGMECGFNLPFMTEKEIFETIEGYDEEYDPYGSNSDPDIMYKMMIAGISPQRCRDTLIYHFSNRSSDAHIVEGDEKKKRLYDWNKNWRYFPRKWGFERDGRTNVWYAGGENGTRIPIKSRPYVFDGAHGHDIHPGKDWLEYKPEWKGKYGRPFYGKGEYYEQ